LPERGKPNTYAPDGVKWEGAKTHTRLGRVGQGRGRKAQSPALGRTGEKEKGEDPWVRKRLRKNP